MKPSCPVARRRDYVVRDCSLSDAADLIRAEHYARGCANTAVYVHGLFRGNELVGAALWLPPTKPCAQKVAREEKMPEQWRRVLSLSRVALKPSEPQNAESLLIGASIRRVRRTRRWAALVTFADCRKGHGGTIYRATNWIDRGLTRPEPVWEDAQGRQVSRLSTKSRTKAQMEAMGFQMIGKFQKRRFVLVLEPSAAQTTETKR